MSSIKEVICICCPCGCHLQVDPENDYNVTGNACPNGAAYGREELTHPTRIITSTVRVEGGLYPRCPVKTAQAVPKEKMTEVMAALPRGSRMQAKGMDCQSAMLTPPPFGPAR